MFRRSVTIKIAVTPSIHPVRTTKFIPPLQSVHPHERLQVKNIPAAVAVSPLPHERQKIKNVPAVAVSPPTPPTRSMSLSWHIVHPHER